MNKELEEAIKILSDFKKENSPAVNVESLFVNKAIETFLNYIENSIPKKKVEEILQKNRNELFSITYVEPKQYEPFEMQIERINKIEKELLKGK